MIPTPIQVDQQEGSMSSKANLSGDCIVPVIKNRLNYYFGDPCLTIFGGAQEIFQRYVKVFDGNIKPVH